MPTTSSSKANPIGLNLRLRPIGPNHRSGRGHSYRLVSWNVRGTYAPYDYLYTAIATKADVFVIQEPYCPDATDSYTNWLQQEALRRGYDLYVSSHTFVYIRIDHLGRRVIENHCIDDGRAQIFLLRFDPTTPDQEPTYSAIVGAYGYQIGTETDPSINRRPADLFNAVSDRLGKYQESFGRNLTTFIIGDLQSTIDNSAIHNAGRARARTSFNLLTLAESISLISAVPTKHPTTPYHTRANAGIDHIMIAAHLAANITAAGICPAFADQLLNSDHHLIFADIIFGTPSPPPPRQELIEEIGWRSIGLIPLRREKPNDTTPNDNTPDDTAWWIPDNRADTRANAKRMTLYEKLQAAAQDPHVLEHKKEAKAQLDIAKAKLHDIYTKFAEEEHTPDECPSWTPDIADAIDEAHNNIMLGQETMMRIMGLITLTTPEKARQKYLKKFERSYSTTSPDDATFPAYQKLHALTNAAVANCATAIDILPNPPPIHSPDLVDSDDETDVSAPQPEPLLPPIPRRKALQTAHSVTRLVEYAKLLTDAAADFDKDRTANFFEQQDQIEEREDRKRQMHGRSPIQTSQILLDTRQRSCEIAARMSGNTTHWEPGNGRRSAPPHKHQEKYQSLLTLFNPWLQDEALPDTTDEDAWVKITRSPTFTRTLRTVINRLRRYRVALRQSRAAATRADENYLAHTNQLGELCRKFGAKQYDPPKLQGALITPSANHNPTIVQALTAHEQIQATKQMQERQMQKPTGTPAPFGCDYIYGPYNEPINFTYNNKSFTADDLPAYCGNRFDDCSPEARQHIIDAHRNHESEFREPASYCPELIWPFSYDLDTKEMTATAECNRLINRIGHHPSKMRHNGYSLHFLARLEDSDWFHMTSELMAIILTIRYQPRASKDSTRALIPKPDSRTDRRPICLATDLSAELSAIVQHFLSLGVEKANILPDWAKAYRKGRSVDECTIAMLSAIEDNCQYGLKKGAILAIVDEDFEKFYDTISGLFQAHCMRQMGCPHHGYIDWLFDDLGPNTVIIKTVDYHIYSTFTNGLRQGKGFSCPVATIVATYVVNTWIKNVHRDPALTYGNDRDDLAYALHTRHPADPSTPTTTANSYSDDNAKAFGATYDVSTGDFGTRMARARAAEAALSKTTRYQIKTGGELTTLTKMARKAPKCQVGLTGVPPMHADAITTFSEFAWDYHQQRPLLSNIKTVRQTSHLPPSLRPPTTGTPPDQIYFRNFGSYINFSAHVRPRDLSSFRRSIARCFQRGRSRAAAVDLFNTMVASHFQFNVLVLGGPIADTCIGIDLVVHNTHGRFFGLTHRDPKHKIWINQANMGHGLRSVAAGLLQAFLREQEVLLNKPGSPFNNMRSRLVAYPDDHQAKNFTHHTIREVAAFGFFPRNGHEPLHTMMMLQLASAALSHNAPLGLPGFRPGEKPSKHSTSLSDALLGRGAPNHGRRYCLYGPIDHWLRQNFPLDDPVLRLDGEMPLICTTQYWHRLPTTCPHILPGTLATTARKSLHTILSQQKAEAWVAEWRVSLSDPRPDKSTRWNLLTFPSHTEPLTPDELGSRVPAFGDTIRLDPGCSDRRMPYARTIDGLQPATLAASDAQVYNRLRHYKSFPILASDAGRAVINGEAYIVAAAVLCTIDLRQIDINSSTDWEHLPTIPLLARVKLLPKQYGTTTTTNNVGELLGILMMDDILPPTTPALQFTDSLINQGPAISLRDNRATTSHRTLTRHTLKSPCRALMHRLDAQMQRIADTYAWDHPEICAMLRAVTTAADDWPGRRNDITPNPVPKASIDKHPYRPLMHVNSHQLTKDGKLKQPKGAPPQQAIPCFMAVSANFWPDTLCTIAQENLRQPTRAGRQGGPPLTTAMRHDGITMPHTPAMFNIFHDNVMIDTSASDYADDCHQRQLCSDYAARPRHGWPDRYSDCITNTAHIQTGSMLHALAHGRGKCHVRDAYCDQAYRLAIFHLQYGANAEPTKDLHEFTDATLRRCRFCPEATNSPTGDTIHLHCYCTHPDISEIRNHANQGLHTSLHGLHILSDLAPGPTPCFITNIGEGMLREDRKPARRPDGKADIHRHLRQSIHTSITTIDQWRAEEANRQNAMTNCNLPLHPAQAVRDSANWAILAGLIPCRAEGGDHSNDTVTDMLFLGILPAEIDRDFTATLQHFLSATKMTWDQLDEHYHNLCDTNRTLAALMPLQPEDPNDPDSPLVRPSVKSTFRKIWKDVKAHLAERTAAIQRVAGTLQSIYARRLKKQISASRRVRDQFEDPPPSDEDDDDGIPPEKPIAAPTRPRRHILRLLCTGPGCTIAVAKDLPNRQNTYPSTKSNNMCPSCGHVQATQNLCSALERAALKSSTIRLELASYRSRTPQSRPEHFLQCIERTALQHILHPNRRRDRPNSSPPGKRTATAATQLLAHTIGLQMADRNHYWWDQPPTEGIMTAAKAICPCHPNPRLAMEPTTPIWCHKCNKLNPHPATPSLSKCRSCNMTSSTDACSSCHIFALLHLNSHQARLNTIGLTQPDLQPTPPPTRPENPYLRPPRLGANGPPSRRTPQHRPIPELNPTQLFHVSQSTQQRIETLWRQGLAASSRNRPPTISHPETDDTNAPTITISDDPLPPSSPPHGETHIPHQYVPRYTITYDDYLLTRPREWLNDAIINNIGRLMCAKAPHSRVRKWWTSNNIDILRRDPRDPAIARSLRLRRSTRTDPDERPSIQDPLILTAWNYGLHWTLLIREREPDGTIHIYLMDSLYNEDDEDTINDIRTIIQDSILVPADWDGNITIIPGLTQSDNHNCGVYVLLHAYFWIFHSEALHPKDINWDRFDHAIPNLIENFRKYIAAILITGSIENYFQGTRLHTINNPNPPTNPTHTNQLSLDDFLTCPSQDDTTEAPSPPPRQSASRRRAQAQRRKIRKRRDRSDISNP